jgi:pimeloyl-[acyl-carrier protein] methyl ester esterase
LSEQLYSETSGSGEPLVLLHGWAMNLRVFDSLRAGLADHYAVTAIDLPGHGRSPDLPDLAAPQQLALLASLVPRGATLVGWSLGGQLALQLASDTGLGVRRLALLSSTPRFVCAEHWPHGVDAALMRQFASQLRRDPAKTVTAFLDLQVRGGIDAAGVLAALKQALRANGEASAGALAAGLTLLERNDLRELARRIAIPALVITGEHDQVTSPQAGRALARLLPHAWLLELTGAGHAGFLSHREQVLAALLALQARDGTDPCASERRAAP